jgi:DNA-binding NarL/FixJ family response regulator
VARNRLLLVDLPRMLRDLIAEAVASRADIELVGELSAGDSVAAALERYAASVVILPIDHPEARGQAKALLANARADVRIVALDPDGRSGLVFDLQPRQTRVGEVSLHGLVELIGGGDRSG